MKYFLIPLLLSLFLICIVIIEIIKIKKNNNYFNNKINEKEELYKKILRQQEEKIEQQLSFQKSRIDNSLKAYKEEKLKEIELDLYKQQQSAAECFNQFQITLEDKKNILNNSIQELTDTLLDLKNKQDVINNEIDTKRKIFSNLNFYTLNLSKEDINDIEELKSIEGKIHNKEAINRLIYDVFIKKNAMEMVKRILAGTSPSGIYKITFIPTGESYIGRAVSVDKRWIEHIKSCFGLGTIASSSLHLKMAKEGIWNFSFQLLEAVPKENLNSREKYWIDFYNTKKVGMNEKDGNNG
jgi:hypothetical protein